MWPLHTVPRGVIRGCSVGLEDYNACFYIFVYFWMIHLLVWVGVGDSVIGGSV